MTEAAFDSPENLRRAKDIAAKYWTAGERPEGLLTDLYRAIRDAETRGFADCMAIYNGHRPANDDTPPALFP